MPGTKQIVFVLVTNISLGLSGAAQTGNSLDPFRPLSGQEISPIQSANTNTMASGEFVDTPITDVRRATQLLRELDVSAETQVVSYELKYTDAEEAFDTIERLALLEDRPYCVFDEWAADQSTEFRDTFYTAIVPRLTAMGKAVVVATHDDRYFHLADRLIKLDEGRLVEFGPFSTSAASLDEVGESITRNNGRSPADNLDTPAPSGVWPARTS